MKLFLATLLSCAFRSVLLGGVVLVSSGGGSGGSGVHAFPSAEAEANRNVLARRNMNRNMNMNAPYSRHEPTIPVDVVRTETGELERVDWGSDE